MASIRAGSSVVDKKRLIEIVMDRMKDNPILTIWSLFIAPVISAIVYDVYLMGLSDRVVTVLQLIGIIYVVVMVAVAILDSFRKRMEASVKKKLITEENEYNRNEIERIRVENQHLIDMANEDAKIEIIRRVSDLDYHLRLYDIYQTTNASDEKKKIISDGIDFQREQLSNISLDYRKFTRYYVFGEKMEKEKSDAVPRPKDED